MNAVTKALRRQNGTFGLQITSMIDMFTIILVFLLKSYASSAVDVTPSKSMSLPGSTANTAPIEALKLQASKEGIFVDDKNVQQLVNGELPRAQGGQDDQLIPGLYEALQKQVQKSKDIANKNDTVQFEGKIIFQGDRSLKYQTIRRIMYTSVMAGYSDFKFAVVTNN
jgi:biopolymer transport protein ExbD